MDDAILLGRYVETGCQESFEQIVTRHSGWVFSLSLRAVRDRHLAEDVTQAVFLILARKAKTIRAGTPLSGWLFKASRFAVSDALKRRTRMKNRENRFAEFFKATAAEGSGADGLLDSAVADDVSQTLDEAVACLSETDRQAVLLRFYEGKSLAEVGQILGTSEEAAKKRVARAVERLRKYFASRGAMASAALILFLLGSRTAEAAGYVPAALSPTAISVAHSMAHSIAEGALKLMANAQAKLLGAIFAAGFALLVSIPTLGGAIAYITAPPAPVARTTPAPLPLPDPTSDLVDGPKRALPEEQSRFAELWVGYKGQLLWRSDAYREPPALPFYLKSADRHDQPYAVGVDGKGNYFLKPLSSSILSAPVIRQAQFDYDAGPFEPTARVREMLSVIDANTHGGGFDIMPASNSKKLVDQDWRKLRHVTDDDNGTAVVEDFKAQLRPGISGPSQFVAPGGFDGRDQIVEAPEPSVMLLAAGAGSLLLLRRRRK